MPQPSPSARRARRSILLLPAIAAASLAIAACGSSGSSGSSDSSGSGKSGGSTTSQKTPGSNASSSSATATVKTTKVSGYGTVLASTKGSPLYLLTADPSGGSSCTGACAKQWVPLSVSGKPTAGPGVSASLLSSFKRSDGTEQVTYAGHALYSHPGMSATTEAGTASDGGVWYLVAPSGKPVKTTTGGGY